MFSPQRHSIFCKTQDEKCFNAKKEEEKASLENKNLEKKTTIKHSEGEKTKSKNDEIKTLVKNYKIKRESGKSCRNFLDY